MVEPLQQIFSSPSFDFSISNSYINSPSGELLYLVNPDHPDEVTMAARSILRDGAARNSLVERGARRAAAFSSAAMAKGIVDVYEKALGN